MFTCQVLIANYLFGLLRGAENWGCTAHSRILRLHAPPIRLLFDPELGGSTEHRNVRGFKQNYKHYSRK
jgi:hypothetical protein